MDEKFSSKGGVALHGDNDVKLNSSLSPRLPGEGQPEIHSQPDNETFDLGEDIYSLIFVSPIRSAPFIFSCYIVILKLALFTFLAIDLRSQSSGDFDEKTPLIRVVQFLMLPGEYRP